MQSLLPALLTWKQTCPDTDHALQPTRHRHHRPAFVPEASGREVKEEVGIKGLLRETARVPERRDFSTVTPVNIWGQSVLGL